MFDLETPKLQLEQFGFFTEKIDAAGRLAAGPVARCSPARRIPSSAAAAARAPRPPPRAARRRARRRDRRDARARRSSSRGRASVPGAKTRRRHVHDRAARARRSRSKAATSAPRPTARSSSAASRSAAPIPSSRASTATSRRPRSSSRAPAATASRSSSSRARRDRRARHQPTGATVEIDGKPAGTTPTHADDAAAGHDVTVMFKKAGYQDAIDDARPCPAPARRCAIVQPLAVSDELARIKLVSEPAGAQVIQNGQLLAGVTTPAEVLVEAGKPKRFMLTLPNHGARASIEPFTPGRGADRHRQERQARRGRRAQDRVERRRTRKVTIAARRTARTSRSRATCVVSAGTYTVDFIGPQGAQRDPHRSRSPPSRSTDEVRVRLRRGRRRQEARGRPARAASSRSRSARARSRSSTKRARTRPGEGQSGRYRHRATDAGTLRPRTTAERQRARRTQSDQRSCPLGALASQPHLGDARSHDCRSSVAAKHTGSPSADRASWSASSSPVAEVRWRFASGPRRDDGDDRGERPGGSSTGVSALSALSAPSAVILLLPRAYRGGNERGYHGTVKAAMIAALLLAGARRARRRRWQSQSDPYPGIRPRDVGRLGASRAHPPDQGRPDVRRDRGVRDEGEPTSGITTSEYAHAQGRAGRDQRRCVRGRRLHAARPRDGRRWRVVDRPPTTRRARCFTSRASASARYAGIDAARDGRRHPPICRRHRGRGLGPAVARAHRARRRPSSTATIR